MHCCNFTLTGDEQPPIKCVVWDLDDTIWQGTLLEGDSLILKPGIKKILEELDRRGILNAIASKNEASRALAQLSALGIGHLFVVSQIGWASKSVALQEIATQLGLGLDAFLFIDDQEYERDEVRFSFPHVETFDSSNLGTLLSLPRLTPKFITADSGQRRLMYQADLIRQQSQTEFVGTRDDFLRTLQMRVVIRLANESDLRRAEELTIRTNQLNTTGRTYSYWELLQLLNSPSHRLLVVELWDRYGPSGTIGLALLEIEQSIWLIKLLIMSCRVISRGIGSILLGYILAAAQKHGATIQSEFVDSGRNRMMYITYKFAGFTEKGSIAGVQILEHDLLSLRSQPDYVELDACGL